MKKYLISALALGAMATSLNASCQVNECTDPEGIFRAVPVANGVLLNTYGDERKLNCTPVGAYPNTYILLKMSHPNYKAMYSTVLASMMSNKSITIRATSTGSCEVGYLYITK